MGVWAGGRDERRWGVHGSYCGRCPSDGFLQQGGRGARRYGEGLSEVRWSERHGRRHRHRNWTRYCRSSEFKLAQLSKIAEKIDHQTNLTKTLSRLPRHETARLTYTLQTREQDSQAEPETGKGSQTNQTSVWTDVPASGGQYEGKHTRKECKGTTCHDATYGSL